MRENDVVSTELMGDVWPATQPGEDPVLYGHVELTPRGAFEARSVQTFSAVLARVYHCSMPKPVIKGPGSDVLQHAYMGVTLKKATPSL